MDSILIADVECRFTLSLANKNSDPPIEDHSQPRKDVFYKTDNVFEISEEISAA